MFKRFRIDVDNTGATRIVFLTKKYAIKVPRYKEYSPFYGFLISILSGWECNRTEYRWYKYEPYKEYLCPIRYSFLFSFIIVMDRVELITDDEFKCISKFPINNYEHKRDSYGKKGNRLYVIDYALSNRK